MNSTLIDRRRFMVTGVGASALGLFCKAQVTKENSGLPVHVERGYNDGGPPFLTEDYQVIQRDENDCGSCRIRLSAQDGASALDVHIVDEAGRIWMDKQVPVQHFGSGSTGIVIESIPVGGPYIIRVSSQVNGPDAGVIFRNILVGDIWILAGQIKYVRNRVSTLPRTEIKLKSVSFGNTPKPTIIVEFTAISGKLRAPGRPTGFQLRNMDTAEDLEWIYKINLSADAPGKVILELAAKQETANLALLYAPGAAPFVNITDENDMALPAFGPVAIHAPANS